MTAACDETPNEVLTERVGEHVLLVTINRPAARNSVNVAVTRGIADALSTLESDATLRVAVLTGAGDKAFCAGADLSEVAAGRGAEIAGGEGGFAGLAYAERTKPWIAAVRGFALGGGTELALACDMVVAGESASFGFPEVKRGLIAGAGGVYRIARAIPRALALELLLIGDAWDATQAYRSGLINRVFADDDVLPNALAIAQRIADNAPIAVREGLAIARAAHDQSEIELRNRSRAAGHRLLASSDLQEGLRAFRERRKPQWTDS